VSQVSLPVRILLIGAVVFLAAWFTVLRPKPATIDATPVAAATPTGTPQTGFGRAVADARRVAGAAKSAAAAATKPEAPAATATPTATPAAPPIAIPAATLAKLPKDVSGALQARKTLVIGVIGDESNHWRPLADDDRYVRNTLSDVNRYAGQVLVKTVPVTNLATYAPLLGGLDLSQTPSVVVIDAKLKGDVLPGYVDRVTVNQAIQDARRASGTPTTGDTYLDQANAVCLTTDTALGRWSQATIAGPKADKAADKRLKAVWKGYRHAVSALDAPAKWRALKKQWLAQIAHAGHPNRRAAAADHKQLVKLDRAFDKAGAASCSVLRPS
jgi:hypothetical protein